MWLSKLVGMVQVGLVLFPRILDVSIAMVLLSLDIIDTGKQVSGIVVVVSSGVA